MNPMQGLRIYTGPENVRTGQHFHLIDPLTDEPKDGDEYQLVLHADQEAIVVKALEGGKRVLVETTDGARFTVARRSLAVLR